MKLTDAVELTDAAVRKYKPHPKQRRSIRDLKAESLFLYVYPSGKRAWAMRFRTPTGRIAKITLGPLDQSGHELKGDPEIGMPLTLAAARALAADIHRQRARGEDVAAEHAARRQRQRSEAVEANGSTFKGAAHDFIMHHRIGGSSPRKGQRPRRWRDSATQLGLRYADGDEPQGEPDIIPNSLADRWCSKPVREIDEANIWQAVKEARELGVPGLGARNKERSEARGRHLYAALSSMFTWLRKERRVSVNPCQGVDRPDGPTKRSRVLNVKSDVRGADELRWFWQACDQVGEPFSIALKMLLLTGCRLGEIVRMTWNELNDEFSILHLSGERTKNGLPHDVPLPPPVRELLEKAKARRIHGCKYVFTTDGKSPMWLGSKIKHALDVAMLELARAECGDEASIPQWRLHDLRRSCVTGMGEIGIQPHIVEATINHVSGHKSGVAGTYNLAAYLPERKAALERWAAHVHGLISERPDNIVAISRRKRRGR